jgi:hypothetical protein
VTIVLAFGSETADAGEATTASAALDFTYTTVKGSGTYATRFAPSAAAALLRLRGVDANGAPAEMALTTAYVGAWVQVNAATDAAIALIGFQNSANANMVHLRHSVAGNFQFQYANGSDVLTTVVETMAITQGRPYYVEISAVDVGTAGSSSIECRIDGVVYGTASSLTIRSAARTLDRTASGAGGAHTTDWVLDDVYVDTAGFQGKIGVELLTPRADGDLAEWNEGTGNTFAEVDELPHDSDTSYIKESGLSATQYAYCQPASNRVADGRVLAVKAGAVVRDEGVVALLAVGVREQIADAEQRTTAADATASYVLRALYATVDPNTTAAWTKVRVNDSQVLVASTAATAVRCTSMWLQVVYQPKKQLWPLLGVT